MRSVLISGLVPTSALAFAASVSFAACQDDSDGDTVTNGCGTFDLREPGDGGVPQDPDDVEIVDACGAGGATCSVPAACQDLQSQTGFCGG